MKKKILALMLALVVACSIGAFTMVSAAGETAESFVSVSAIDSSKADLTPVNVKHETPWVVQSLSIWGIAIDLQR